MKVLIIHAHPSRNSFNGRMTDAAAEVLKGLGHTVKVTDLYAEHFHGEIVSEDFLERKAMDVFDVQGEQKKASLEGKFAPEIKKHIDDLLEAELVILQFPSLLFFQN